MSFVPFLAKRLIGLLALLLALSAMVFFFSRSIPGDVAAMYIGGMAKPEQIQRARKELGLDRPLYVQYLKYMEKLFKGDMGFSFRTHRPVFQDLLEKTSMSMEIVLWALALAMVLGIGLGGLAAMRQGSGIDEAIKWLSSAAVSIPIFFLALLLQLIFFNFLGWFPLQGRMDTLLEFSNPIKVITGFSLIDALLNGNLTVFFNVAWHMALPVVSLIAYPFGLVARLTRSSLLEIMAQDYILAARASGIGEGVLFFRYGLRNALSPVLTVVGLSVALTLLSTFYVEIIFNWPGVGYYAMMAILSLDYPVLMGVTLMIGTVYVLANTSMDILRRLVDPRIK
jgi:ABC-type dipeptide/oligopeptide/nickel transport system permease component